MTNYTSVIKVTEYPPHIKHITIFETYANLQPSESMLIVNDHDPLPLRFQLESKHKGDYAFENSAKLFEALLEIDPKNYNSFSLNAPDSFFHCLYGGMISLYPDAQKYSN